MAEPFIGQITLFPYNFAPYGWMVCAGQILPIQQYTALFSLLGTAFGGNGTSNFALPNLVGNVAVGQGQLPGGSIYEMGDTGGSQTVSVLQSEMPAHTHPLVASTVAASAAAATATTLPAQGYIAGSGGKGGTSPGPLYLYANSASGKNVNMAIQSLAPAGGSLPHNNVQPSLTLNWCIAMQGVFPSRG